MFIIFLFFVHTIVFLGHPCQHSVQCYSAVPYAFCGESDSTNDANDDEKVCMCADGFAATYNGLGCVLMQECTTSGGNSEGYSPTTLMKEDDRMNHCGAHKYCDKTVCKCETGYAFNRFSECVFPIFAPKDSTVIRTNNANASNWADESDEKEEDNENEDELDDNYEDDYDNSVEQATLDHFSQDDNEYKGQEELDAHEAPANLLWYENSTQRPTTQKNNRNKLLYADNRSGKVESKLNPPAYLPSYKAAEIPSSGKGNENNFREYRDRKDPNVVVQTTALPLFEQTESHFSQKFYSNREEELSIEVEAAQLKDDANEIDILILSCVVVGVLFVIIFVALVKSIIILRSIANDNNEKI